jgi:NAD(P)H-nitrite reductase large subunit
MSRPRTVVIVGAGWLARRPPNTARGRLRRSHRPARRRAHAAYERPPLSKEYLRDEATAEKVFVHDEDFYDKYAIDLRVKRS